LLQHVHKVREQLNKAHQEYPELWSRYFDDCLLNVPLLRLDPRNVLPDVIPVARDDKKSADFLAAQTYMIAAATCGGIYRVIKDRWTNKNLFGHHFCDLLLLDEASQLSLPEAMMAALPLHPQGQLLVVGDPRQMPPIVQHDWDREARRTFRQYRAYESLFDSLAPLNPPRLGFARSFRLHAVLADVLRQEVYRHDGIPYYSERTAQLPTLDYQDLFVGAVLSSEHPLVVVVHDEADSQKVNAFETALLGPVIKALMSSEGHRLDAETGFGVVVPHRAQRVALRRAYPELIVSDPITGDEIRSAVETIERYQGDERDVILVSATESDPDYLLASAGFLLEPRRLTVALSRAKTKLILIASRSVFEFFTTDEEIFTASQLWKNLLRRVCRDVLWNGRQDEVPVRVYGSVAQHTTLARTYDPPPFVPPPFAD
jgi:superfamily I DNA and/or RNA helicase